MIRKIFAAFALATLVLLGLGGAQAQATATTDETVITVSNEIVNAPDNGCPAWARDTFTRELTITGPNSDGEYAVRSDADGTWTETDGSGTTGTLTGFVEYTVKGTLLDDDAIEEFDGTKVDYSDITCKGDNPNEAPTYSAGRFALNYFETVEKVGDITDWEYTYDTTCTDPFVEPDDGEVGAETFGELCDLIAHPTQPTITQPVCGAPGFLNLPDAVEGVEGYLVEDELYTELPTQVSFGHPTESILVEAILLDGYTGLEIELGWRFTFEWPTDCETPSPDPTPTETPSPTETPDPSPTPSETPSPSESPETPTEGCAAYVDADWCAPGVTDYNCADLEETNIELVDPDIDPFDLDGDGNGIGCESPDDPPAEGELPDTGSNAWVYLLGIGLLAAGSVAVFARHRWAGRQL